MSTGAGSGGVVNVEIKKPFQIGSCTVTMVIVFKSARTRAKIVVATF